MLKDVYLKILFIPALGITLPLLSGVVHFNDYAPPLILLITLYFILTSFIIWYGCNWIHRKIRAFYPLFSHFARRMLAIAFGCTLYGACVGCLSALGWLHLSKEIFDWRSVMHFVLACATVVIVFTLVYEILFLTKEREEDIKTVDLLDRERSQAELHALQNEMDPHFLFNALNTLNHLILHNPAQAHLYNNKLAQVYKYFLINKNKELIPLPDELDFIDTYFFLLQLRYDKKLQLEIQLDTEYPARIKIPPCSLQILLENAIKHNSFSDEEPLRIVIMISGQYINVVNRVKPKPYIIDSTKIGLNNLNCRYKLLFNKNIIITPGKENFTVKLPVIR